MEKLIEFLMLHSCIVYPLFCILVQLTIPTANLGALRLLSF